MSVGAGWIFAIFVFYAFYYLMEIVLPEKYTDGGGQFPIAFIMAVISLIFTQLLLS